MTPVTGGKQGQLKHGFTAVHSGFSPVLWCTGAELHESKQAPRGTLTFAMSFTVSQEGACKNGLPHPGPLSQCPGQGSKDGSLQPSSKEEAAHSPRTRL